MNYLIPPYHLALNQYKEVALGDVISHREFKDQEYVLEQGKLVLPNQGKPLSVVVAAGDRGPKNYPLKEVESIFKNFLELRHEGEKVRPQEIREFFTERLQKHVWKINENLTRKGYEFFTDQFGLPPIVLSENDMPLVMHHCSNSMWLNYLLEGDCSIGQLQNLMTGVFAQRMQQAEYKILSSIPSEAFESPVKLRSILTNLLKERGLTHAEAISKFDRTQAKESSGISESSVLDRFNISVKEFIDDVEKSRRDAIAKIDHLLEEQSSENDSVVQDKIISATKSLLEGMGTATAECASIYGRLNRKEPPKEQNSYILAKLIAQVDAWEALLSNPKGKGIPFREVWRFYIDGDKEAEGAYRFETEPFYMLSVMNGFGQILKSMNPPSKESYESYLEALTRNPAVLKDERPLITHSLCERDLFKLGIATGYRSYRWDMWKHDALGIEDLKDRSELKKAAEERINKKSSKDLQDLWLAYSTSFTIAGGSLSIDVEKPNVVTGRIFHGLEQMLAASGTPGERLIAYIWAARELEINHLLEDGNGRASISALIKWIADDKDLPIYMPEDPNILDGQGPEAIIRDVHSGMIRYWKLSGGQSLPVPSADELVSQANVQGKSWSIVHKRAMLPIEVIHQLLQGQ